jgi:D-alanine-D-alanine ligase-like ATP-grasp enzyme
MQQQANNTSTTGPATTATVSGASESKPPDPAAASAPSAVPKKPIRVAVLTASYGDSDSILKKFDDFESSPAWFFTPRWPPQLAENKIEKDPDSPNYNVGLTAEGADGPFEFELVPLNKKSVFRDLRAIVKSGKFDVFFNLCDGAKDEDRAGEEVVRTLEELNVPFTGAPSWCYEPSKPEMKQIANFAGIKTARSTVVDKIEELEEKCAKLRFPVIVKHVSGYASIGMTPESKCKNMDALKKFAAAFIAEHNCALIEEFVTGIEATVLACADPTAEDGIRVYPPVAVDFPGGNGDFKYFALKWVNDSDMKWRAVSPTSPAYDKIVKVGRVAFKAILGGVGYGRSDVRIDENTGEVVFLEINPNCGILYPYAFEGSADWVLRYAGKNGQGHRDFITLQINSAIERHAGTKPACALSYDLAQDAYVVRAERRIKAHTIAWNAAYGPQIYFAGEVMSAPGAVPRTCIDWRPLKHSTSPNVVLRTQANGYRCLLAVRDIEAGAMLELDFMCPSGDTARTTTNKLSHRAENSGDEVDNNNLPSPSNELTVGANDGGTNVTCTTAYDAAAYDDFARRKTLSTAGIISEAAS